MAPLNVERPLPAELRPALAGFQKELLRVLRARRIDAVAAPGPVDTFRESWSARLEAAGGRSAEAARALLLARAEVGDDYDDLLVAAIVTRSTTLEKAGAHWDGVYRKLSIQNRPRSFQLDVLTGSMTAYSLEVVAWSRTGLEVHRGIGGVDFKYRVRISGGRARNETNPHALTRSRHVQESVELALTDYPSALRGRLAP